MTVLAVGVAGSLGALARYGLTTVMGPRTFPWGTFVVNAIGSFVLGVAVALLTERYAPDPAVRLAITVGFLGAFTTFSTYSLETVQLIEDGALGLATANALGSVVVGLVAAYLGLILGRAV